MPLFNGNAQKATSALIAAIYDAALDPTKWQDFINALHRELDGVEPVFYLADTKSATMEMGLVSENWGEAFLAPYIAYYNAVNPWLPGLARTPEIGKPVTGDDYISESDLKRTEFYNDFFKHWGGTGAVGTIPYRDQNAFSLLGLHCSRRTLDRHGTELCRVAAQLAPHINRAFEISRQLQHGAAWRASLEQMLESLASPALLIGANLHVRYANGAAEAIFHSGVLALDSQGRIAAGAGAQETKALRSALTEALDPVPTARAPSAIKLTRPDDDQSVAMPLLARVMPCAGGTERAMDAPTFIPPLAREPEALLLIADPAAKLHVRQQRLQQLFDLTQAEARLAQALAQGISLQGYATAYGITEGTARVQLKSVFAKTDTHRQAELVALLALLSRPFQLG